MTVKTSEQYADSDGASCPVCGSNDLIGQGVVVDSGGAIQEMECEYCESKWDDAYTLEGYENLENTLKEKDLFDKEFIESLGFKVEKDDGKYGKAVCSRNGMTVLYWNRKGCHCTYFGDPVDEENSTFSVRKDADTRYAFNGYVFTRDDIKQILKMTW